jgi:D-alanyl-lipoteichoic acid acyltransferase DltB (MBOAT superfamily)
MPFTSMAFVYFLFLFGFVFLLVPRRFSYLLFLTGSYIFYGWWDWKFLGLLMLTSVTSYLVAIEITVSERPEVRRRILTVGLVVILGVLGIFKYANFFALSLSAALSAIGVQVSIATLNFILPVGISFYTFQTMGYTIDVFRGSIQAERNFLRFAAFVSFFPLLLAGPIERGGHLLPQLKGRPFPGKDDIHAAVWQIVFGYFLKVFLSDNLSVIVNEIYQNLHRTSAVDLLIGHYAYAFQIYGDFAGYSFIAMGVARLFGIQLKENFHFPYFVSTPQDFWRHWHITLSQWLRDYLYIPLGGNRGSRSYASRNLMLTMLLGGLWHGAAWNFVLWGGYHGLLLVIYRMFSGKTSTLATPVWKRFAKWFLMFNLICFGWLLFRVPDMQTLQVIFARSISVPFSVSYRTLYWSSLSTFYIGFPLAILLFQWRESAPIRMPFKSSMLKSFTYFIMVFLLTVLGNWGTRNFIYFQF